MESHIARSVNKSRTMRFTIRHSGAMRQHRTRNLEIPGWLLRSAPERRRVCETIPIDEARAFDSAQSCPVKFALYPPRATRADRTADRNVGDLSAMEVGMQLTTTEQQRSGADELELLDRYWRAANYLSVGQIYLMDNPLLKQPLSPAHIKPRLLGHWGTTPGLNFIYAHLNRAIRAFDLDVIYVCGPGHGGPGMVANTYLEGSYTEIYPHITRDADGLRKLFRQFSFPGGIPSHAAPETPGSIHEGGELGYALVHAYGAAFDNPDLIVACV